MSLDKYFFIAGALFLIIYFLIKNKKSRLNLILPVLGILFLFAPLFLPSSFFGKWDLIKELKNKEIRSLILQPSQPAWEVNLVDSVVKIENKKDIEYLLSLLHKTEIYSPNHPIRIWEVKLIFVTGDNDSIPLKIEKVEKSETVIYSKQGSFKKKGLAEYLETIVHFYKPVKGK
jgi:energy-coupling factor transporter transmembrane protein EcfT